MGNTGKKLLVGGDLPKERLLNPYKRPQSGTEVNITVNDVPTVAVLDAKNQYTYLNVEGVDCYVTGALTEATSYELGTWTPKVVAKKKADAPSVCVLADEAQPEAA